MKHSFNILKCLGILLVYSIFLNKNTFASKPKKLSTIEADSANIVSQELIDKYIEVGSKRLSELMAMNEINDRNGESYKNSYIIDYASALNANVNDASGKPYSYNFTPQTNAPIILSAGELASLEQQLTALNATIPVSNGKIYVGVNMWLGEIFYSREPKDGIISATNLDPENFLGKKAFAFIEVRSRFDQILAYINSNIKVSGVLPKCLILSYARYNRHVKLDAVVTNGLKYATTRMHVYDYFLNGVTVSATAKVELNKTIDRNLSLSAPTEIYEATKVLAKNLGSKAYDGNSMDFKSYMDKYFPGWQTVKVDEIKDFINDNPFIYQMYEKKYGTDALHWKNWTSQSQSDFTTKLNNFLAALVAFKNDCGGGLEVALAKTALTETDIINATKCCYPWTAECFKTVSFENKMKMIGVLVDAGLKDYGGIPTYYPTSDLVLRLTESMTKSTDQQLFLNRLLQTVSGSPSPNVLIYSLTRPSGGLSTSSLDKFLGIILGWIADKNTPKDLKVTKKIYEEAIANNKYLYVVPSIFSLWTTGTVLTNGKIVFYESWKYPPLISKGIPKIYAYDWMVVEFQDDLLVGTRGFHAGEKWMVPAIYAYLLATNANEVINHKVTSGIINLLLMYTGLGELNVALETAQTTKAAVALTDVLVGAAGLVIEGGLYNKLNGSKEGQKFLQAWGYFNMYYGATSLTLQLNSAALDSYIGSRKLIKEEGLQLTSAESKILDDIGNYCLGTNGKACFLPNTPISTPSGFTPIQNIKIGSLVNTYDETTQQNTTKPVTNVFTKTANKIYDIIIGSDTLHATPEHPFYTNGKWTIAQNLRKGMQVLTLAGALLPITQINAHDTLATVHNFEVQDAHTYYVGKQQVLVHNLCKTLEQRLLLEGFSLTVVNKLKNAAIFETKVATEIGEIISQNKALFDKIPANKVDGFLNDLKGLTKEKRAIVDDLYIIRWTGLNTLELRLETLTKSRLRSIGVTDNASQYVLANNSTGGAYILPGVIIEAKEVSLADEILQHTGQKCIFPKTDMQAIEGFLEDGRGFTMKELESNFQGFVPRINEMSSKIKSDPNFRWNGSEGYLKVPFNSFTKNDGSIQIVSKQYVEQQFNAGISRNGFTIKNDGTVKNITVFLSDGTSPFSLDLTKLKP
jgi:Pretoxin HINT domain